MFVLFLTNVINATSFQEITNVRLNLPDTLLNIGDTNLVQFVVVSCDSVIQNNKDTNNEERKRKFVSAFFAFPFPFGFMGAHRVMLGTKPWVPIVYVASFGGCFGILPLIDFRVKNYNF